MAESPTHTFHNFKKLPEDIQLYIWGLAATPTVNQEVYVSFLSIMLEQKETKFCTMLHAMFTSLEDEPYNDGYWRQTIGLLHACKLSRKVVLGRWISVTESQGEHEDYGWTWTEASEEIYQLRENLSTNGREVERKFKEMAGLWRWDDENDDKW